MTRNAYPSYFDCGGWLGAIPSFWGLAPLWSVASCNDEVLPESTDPDELIQYVEISGVSAGQGITDVAEVTFGEAPSRARRRVQDGDVLVSTVRTYLRAIAPVASPPSNMIASTGFAVLRPRTAHPGYLGYVVQAEYFISEVIARSVGVSYPAINASELMTIKVPVPSLSEQTAIASFLDRKTEKIDALVLEQRRLIELLKEKRQAIISRAVTKGRDPNAKMKPSGVEWLGDVPAHWEVRPLKRVSPSLTVGIVVNPSEYVAIDGLPFIYGGDIREGSIEVDGARRITEEDSSRNAKTKLEPGDLVTVRVGAPGVTAVVPETCRGGNCASVMLIRRGDFVSDWLCYVMNSRTVRFQVEVVQYGAAQEQFNISHATEFRVPVPPLPEQQAIADYLNAQTGRIDRLLRAASQAIELLLERRSALISAAVTGKIDVRDAATEDVEAA